MSMGVDYFYYASTWNRHCDLHFNSIASPLTKSHCSGWSMLRYFVHPGTAPQVVPRFWRSYSPNITWMYSLLSDFAHTGNECSHNFRSLQADAQPDIQLQQPQRCNASPKMMPENAHARPCMRVITSKQLPKRLLIFQLSMPGRN